MAFARLPQPTRADDPFGGYAAAPIESLAWLRSPAAPADSRDLILIRPDVAPAVLERLRVAGRPASERVVGYVNGQDPAEGQQVNVLAVAVDLGPRPPIDELEAVGAPESRAPMASARRPAVVSAIKMKEAP
jgi:hypothetical protein